MLRQMHIKGTKTSGKSSQSLEFHKLEVYQETVEFYHHAKRLHA